MSRLFRRPLCAGPASFVSMHRVVGRGLTAFVAAMVLATSGCGLIEDQGKSEIPTGGIPDAGPSLPPDDPPDLGDLGIGASCTTGLQCRPSLGCDEASSTCQPRGDGEPGANCQLSADCVATAFCSPLGKCEARDAMPGQAGDACTSGGGCAAGLTCVTAGLAGICQAEGTGDLGGSCNQSADCRAPLTCSVGACLHPLGIPNTQERLACGGAASGKDESARFLFKIPRSSTTPSPTFFTLPFPNDIRLKDGRIDLTGFSTFSPAAAVLPFNPIERYVDALSADTNGFAVNASVFFRFSRVPDLDTLRLREDDDGVTSITVWNIDKASDRYNRRTGYTWDYRNAATNFICERHLILKPRTALAPSTTYAVIMRGPIKDESGADFVRDEDFDLVMRAQQPSGDPEALAAWQAYAPLRAWIADTSQDASNIKVAAVFTTQAAEASIAALHTATDALANTLSFKDIVKCGSGQDSPCKEASAGSESRVRGCPDTPAGDAFDEYQARVTIPIWQKGTRPYEQPSNGGGIELDGSDQPISQGLEEVCATITVPKGTPPQNGWPTVLYAHGTGGDYRSVIRVGWAQRLAKGDVSMGADVPMATIGFDGALHGPRAGQTTFSTEELVFNILNPVSARDTQLQAGADLFAIAAALGSLSGADIKLDASKLSLFGHSQGANAAALAAGYDPSFDAVVVTGSGALLAQSLVSKTSPIDTTAFLSVLLGGGVSRSKPLNNPFLALMQTYFERSDTANTVHRIVDDPLVAVGAKHLLQIYGTKDSYSPVEVQREFAFRAVLPSISPLVDSYDDIETVTGPVKANKMGFTAAQIQFAPGDFDGHFVGSRIDDARDSIIEFLGTAARDGVPTASR